MKSSLRRIALPGAALVALVGAAVILWSQKPPDQQTARPASRKPPLPKAQARPPANERSPDRRLADLAPGENGVPLPSSLRDTEVDGWIGADDSGHLVVTPGARWFFDYFLSATGEESTDEIRARIGAEIEKRLPVEAAREASDLLDRYLAYRERVRALDDAGPTGDLAERLRDLHRIRVETFGDADAGAIFGEEEQVQALDIERRAVLSDETLTPEERERRLDEIEAKLPESVRQSRSEATAALRLTRDEQMLRDAGGSPEDVRALREQRFGSQAADRLAALDAERADWQARLEDYRRARQRIANDSSLGDDARSRAVESLIAERFGSAERARVKALDEAQSSHRQSAP
jgi:lipase chaperone LimK